MGEPASPRNGHTTARTLAIVQPGTPIAYSHALLGRAPPGWGRGRIREEPLGVPGWVGEGQHVRGRCGLTLGVRDVSGLWVYSMRCVCVCVVGWQGVCEMSTRDMHGHMPAWWSYA